MEGHRPGQHCLRRGDRILRGEPLEHTADDVGPLLSVKGVRGRGQRLGGGGGGGRCRPQPSELGTQIRDLRLQRLAAPQAGRSQLLRLPEVADSFAPAGNGRLGGAKALRCCFSRGAQCRDCGPHGGHSHAEQGRALLSRSEELLSLTQIHQDVVWVRVR